VRGWFFGAPIEAIRRGNVEEWVAWAFHNTLPTLLSEREYVSMQSMVDLCSEWAQLPLPYGEKNPDVKCMRLTLDPVPSMHRPLVFYGVVAGVVPIALSVLMRSYGFKRYNSGTLKVGRSGSSRQSIEGAFTRD
jgi:hypothetical protein